MSTVMELSPEQQLEVLRAQALIRAARERVQRGNRVFVRFGSSEYPQWEWCVYQRASDVNGFHWVLRTSASLASVHEQAIDWLKLADLLQRQGAQNVFPGGRW